MPIILLLYNLKLAIGLEVYIGRGAAKFYSEEDCDRLEDVFGDSQGSPGMVKKKFTKVFQVK